MEGLDSIMQQPVNILSRHQSLMPARNGHDDDDDDDHGDGGDGGCLSRCRRFCRGEIDPGEDVEGYVVTCGGGGRLGWRPAGMMMMTSSILSEENHFFYLFDCTTQ